MSRSVLVSLLVSVCSLTACSVAHSGTAPLCEREVVVVPGTPPAPVVTSPAQAAIQKWLPSRANDPELEAMVDAAMRSGRGRRVASRAVETVGELSAVRKLLVDQGMPDLFLGIPYWESDFSEEAVSRSCAAGVWQLMPETAVELGVEVANCKIGDAVWTPPDGVAASPESPYRGDQQCRITSCEVDERKDLAESTRGAVEFLERMWRQRDVAIHPDRAGLVVMAYNTGLGAVLNRMQVTGDALSDLPQCADGGCNTLSAQGAEYLPGVLASAALATCAAAEVPNTRFAQDRNSSLCQAMRAQGLVPDTLSGKVERKPGDASRG